MIDPSKEIKEEIITNLRRDGPLLPIQISKRIKKDSLLTSAFLSELLNEKRIFTSYLRVGSSHLYLLYNQKKELEKFFNYLNPREKDAFISLKEKRILKDSEQEPAIRAALKNLKDFAIPLEKWGELFWRYFEEPLTDSLTAPFEKKKQETNKISKLQEIKTLSKKAQETESNSTNKETKIKNISKQVSLDETKKESNLFSLPKPTRAEISSKRNFFNNPLILPEIKKEKIDSPFVSKVKEFLKENTFELIKEMEKKKSSYKCLIRIDSQLGKITFFTLAKDKKTISELDLKKLISDSQRIPLPAFLIYTKKLGKKAEEFIEKYNSILKGKKMLYENF